MIDILCVSWVRDDLGFLFLNASNWDSYSPFHIVQITDFLEFLREYCKKKYVTFTKV